MKNHRASTAFLISLSNTPFENAGGKEQQKGMHECTVTQGLLTTRQRKAMVHRLWHHARDKNRLCRHHPNSKDRHDGIKAPPPCAFTLILQLVEGIPQPKGVDTKCSPKPTNGFNSEKPSPRRAVY